MSFLKPLFKHKHKSEEDTNPKYGPSAIAPPRPVDPSSLPTATIPDARTFTDAANKKWSIKPIGPIYSSSMPRLGWDNGRTSILNNTVFWNFGDVISLDGFSFDTGFSTGCAFYATPGEILRVD